MLHMLSRDPNISQIPDCELIERLYVWRHASRPHDSFHKPVLTPLASSWLWRDSAISPTQSCGLMGPGFPHTSQTRHQKRDTPHQYQKWPSSYWPSLERSKGQIPQAANDKDSRVSISFEYMGPDSRAGFFLGCLVHYQAWPKTDRNPLNCQPY